MDQELEEELKEREATVAEYSQVERTLHELEAKIAVATREREKREREMQKLQVTVHIAINPNRIGLCWPIF